MTIFTLPGVTPALINRLAHDALDTMPHDTAIRDFDAWSAVPPSLRRWGTDATDAIASAVKSRMYQI